MKRHMMTFMLAALMCMLSVQALSDEGKPALEPGTAVTTGYVQMLNAPSEDAEALMDYYPGVRAEVTGMHGEYAAVTIGAEGGALSGYMPVQMLAGGEESIRREMPMMVRMECEHMVKTYSACDEETERIGEVIMLGGADVLGVSDRWLHVNLDRMGYDSAFVRMDQAVYRLVQADPMSYTYTRPMDDEISFDEAIERAKTLILENGSFGYGFNAEEVTKESLDTCSATLLAQYYPSFEPGLLYEITFFKAEEMDGPDIHAWICLWIDGMEIDSFNFGNG